jgi:hypothetical protein
MNQINFENEFDERLLFTFGELLAALQNIPETDQQDGQTLYLDNGVLKVSSGGA